MFKNRKAFSLLSSKEIISAKKDKINSIGFTLIETMIVIGIITLLSASVTVTVNPGERFEKAKDNQREIHLSSILGAVEQKRTIERGWYDCDPLPEGLDEEDNPIFKIIGTKEEEGYYNLYRCIVPNYLTQALYDPSGGTSEDTKYQIWQNPYTKRISLRFVKEDREIVAGPRDYWVLGIPIVETRDPFDIGYSTAKSGGTITSDGDSPVLERGIAWDTSTQPTVTDNRTIDGSGTGSFESTATSLGPNTIYYVRAYARNQLGIGYGEEKTLTTYPITPTIETLEAIDVSNDAATIRGRVISSGITDPSRRIEWGLTTSYENTENLGVGGAGIFQADIGDLLIGETYYFRACGTNSAGTMCGEQMQFTTQISKPRVVTYSAESITETSATVSGEVTSSGGLTVTDRGICFSEVNSNPTIDDDCESSGSEIGSFNVSKEDLSPGNTYYARAYAVNSEGVGYGVSINFNTLVAFPEITTTDISNITGTSADSGGNVISEGGGQVSIKGVCYNKTGTPTIDNDCTNDGLGYGSFISEIEGLRGGITYYVRAYATNERGTSYGEEKTFDTLISPPYVTTTEPYNAGIFNAWSGGNVLDDGGGIVSNRGICWSSYGLPDLSDNCEGSGSGTGEFTIEMTNLLRGTVYSVRAYAENEEGLSWGDAYNFVTGITLPELTTTVVNNINHNSALSGGNITEDGGGSILARGVCVSLYTGPKLGDDCTNDGTGDGTYISDIIGLFGSTNYYVRAYATNELGTRYGQQEEFSTTPSVTPTVDTTTVDQIGHYDARSGGTITDDGGDPIIKKGVCWSEFTSTPEVGVDDCTDDGSGPNSYTSNIINLDPGRDYYVRAYAQNSVGIGYDEAITFTSRFPDLPVVTSKDPWDVGYNSMMAGGTVTDDGGDRTAERGVCYSDTTTPFYGVHDCVAAEGQGEGEFDVEITNLTMYATYFVRAYVKNTQGITYGALRVAETDMMAPVVETSETFYAYDLFVFGGGNIIDPGYEDGTVQYGICVNTSGNPTINDNCTEDGPSGTGVFSGKKVQGLNRNTTYYMRAYATNEKYTGYGEQVSFTTISDICSYSGGTLLCYDMLVFRQPEIIIPIVETADIDPYLPFYSGGTIVDTGISYIGEGVYKVQAHGLCLSKSPMPTTSDLCYDNGLGEEGAFERNYIAQKTHDLDPDTVYYARAYATNETGTGYGEQKVFTTRSDICTSAGGVLLCHNEVVRHPEIVIPVVQTDTSPDPYLPFYSGGTIVDTGITYYSGSGVYKVQSHGVCVSESPMPTTSDICYDNGLGEEGDFERDYIVQKTHDLEPNTTYYARAYATNETGTGYGEQITFTTREDYCVFSGGRTMCYDLGINTSTYTSCGDNFPDSRNGKVYSTKMFGSQCWMTKNLNYDTGTSWCYDNNSANCVTYGRLYDWSTATTACPLGWQLPSDEDFTTLESIIGSERTTWMNSSGWAGLYGGRYDNVSSSFSNLDTIGYWWSSTSSGEDAWTRSLSSGNSTILRDVYNQGRGFSIRCVELPQQSAPDAPTMASQTSSSITLNECSGGGCEYRLGDGSWQTSTVFSGLAPMTSFSFTQRKAATESNGVSPPSSSASFSTLWECGVNFTDSRDSQIYSTKVFGSQCWMIKNLAYLPSVVGPGTGSESDPYYYVYNYDGTDVPTAKSQINYNNYGVLYNWPATTTACPTGWHVPSDAEFKTLEMYLGMTQVQADATDWRGTDQGTQMKSGGSSGWNGLLGGIRTIDSNFSYIDSQGSWWSSAQYGDDSWSRSLDSGYATVNRVNDNRSLGFSIRCVLD
ncbi:MAG: FISUMP domain-containing protein [Candidatus Pacebacteria bacterium]|nr:FISUMP domain-containing protein [Candidatus Paceibacterota bacterium]